MSNSHFGELVKQDLPWSKPWSVVSGCPREGSGPPGDCDADPSWELLRQPYSKMSATVTSATRCQAFTLHPLVRAEKPPSLAPPPSAPTSREIQYVLGQVLGQVFSYASSHWTSQPHSKSGIIPKLQTEKLRPSGLTSNWLNWGLIAKLTSFPFNHAALTCLAWTADCLACRRSSGNICLTSRQKT